MKAINQVGPFFDEKEEVNLGTTISRRWLTEGLWTKKFIQGCVRVIGEEKILPAPNGSLGLYLSLLALELPKDSEVIVPSFTFYASAMSVVFAGLKPVFVDVDAETFNIDLIHAEKIVSSETKAIMPVHVYGQSVNMEDVGKFARKHKLKVIEDAAQSFGVKFNGIHTGLYGDIGVFSFFADKTITMGEGAIIVTKNKKLYEKIRLLRNQGRPNSGTFIHESIGLNFRITDMQAAVGFSQLKKLAKIRRSRNSNLKLYKKFLKNEGDIKFHSPSIGSEYIPFRAAITTKYKEAIMVELQKNKVATRSFFYPMHLQPKLIKYKRSENMEVSENLYNKGVCLPIHTDLTETDIETICEIVKKCIK